MPQDLRKKELTKHTLHLNAGDYKKLQELYPEVGAAAIIRRLVANFFIKLDIASAQQPAPKPLNLDIKDTK